MITAICIAATASWLLALSAPSGNFETCYSEQRPCEAAAEMARWYGSDNAHCVEQPPATNGIVGSTYMTRPAPDTEESGRLSEIIRDVLFFVFGLAAINCGVSAYWLMTPNGRRWWGKMQERRQVNAEVIAWLREKDAP